MSKKVKTITMLSIFAFLLAVLAPVSADAARVTIRGNGSDSENRVKVRDRDRDSLRQSNRNSLRATIRVTQDTGDNETNKNTANKNGGDVDNTSGDVDADILVRNTTEGNEAETNPCGCVEEEEDIVVIEKNGSDSDNKVRISRRSSHKVRQYNRTTTDTSITVTQDTGGNEANKNTGGDVDLESGYASTIITATNSTGGNTVN